MATYFVFFNFSRTKIIWWLDNPILISPHCVISSFVFVNMWSIRVDVLGVTLVGDFINSLRPKVLQNSRYFFVLDDTFTTFLFSSPNIEPFWYKFIFRSPSICHFPLNILSEFELFDSIFRNLVWSEGLQTIPAVLGFVFGIRSLTKTFLFPVKYSI